MVHDFFVFFDTVGVVWTTRMILIFGKDVQTTQDVVNWPMSIVQVELDTCLQPLHCLAIGFDFGFGFGFGNIHCN